VKFLTDANDKRSWCSDEDFVAAWQNEEFESAEAVATHLGLKVGSVQTRARNISKHFVEAGYQPLREFPKRTVTKKDQAYWAKLAEATGLSSDEESSDES